MRAHSLLFFVALFVGCSRGPTKLISQYDGGSGGELVLHFYSNQTATLNYPDKSIATLFEVDADDSDTRLYPIGMSGPESWPNQIYVFRVPNSTDLELRLTEVWREATTERGGPYHTIRFSPHSRGKKPNQRLEPTPTSVTSAADAAAAPAAGAAHH